MRLAGVLPSGGRRGARPIRCRTHLHAYPRPYSLGRVAPGAAAAGSPPRWTPKSRIRSANGGRSISSTYNLAPPP